MSGSRPRIGVAALSLLMWVTLVPAAKVWRVLGNANVRIESDHVTISVPGAKGEVSAVKLQVRGTTVSLRIERLRIHFRDGRVQEVEVGDVIPGGAESRVIDLDGTGVRNVEIDYESKVVSSSSPRIAKLTLVGKP